MGHRQRVFPNGTLVVEQVNRKNDDGIYSCTASSKQGRSDTQQLTVRVMGMLSVSLRYCIHNRISRFGDWLFAMQHPPLSYLERDFNYGSAHWKDYIHQINGLTLDIFNYIQLKM